MTGKHFAGICFSRESLRFCFAQKSTSNFRRTLQMFRAMGTIPSLGESFLAPGGFSYSVAPENQPRKLCGNSFFVARHVFASLPLDGALSPFLSAKQFPAGRVGCCEQTTAARAGDLSLSLFRALGTCKGQRGGGRVTKASVEKSFSTLVFL